MLKLCVSLMTTKKPKKIIKNANASLMQAETFLPNFTGKVLTNLIQFHSHISFKAAVLNYIGSQLVSKKDREELGRLFKSLDTKGHGSLDKEEVQAAYK